MDIEKLASFLLPVSLFYVYVSAPKNRRRRVTTSSIAMGDTSGNSGLLHGGTRQIGPALGAE